MEIAAIATVGDVMDLLDENRIIVKEGLRRLEHTGNRGLMALLSVNGLWGKKLSAYHIGFVIGPCLNATGRLDVADTALELLLCNDERGDSCRAAGGTGGRQSAGGLSSGMS